MSSRPRLFHFTCQHSYREIGHSGVCLLLPHFHPWIGKKLVWLTEQSVPDRRDVGLTSKHIDCDRMQFRYEVVQPSGVRPWMDSPERKALSRADLKAFENDDDGRPAAPQWWWISDQAVRVAFDRTWHG